MLKAPSAMTWCLKVARPCFWHLAAFGFRRVSYFCVRASCNAAASASSSALPATTEQTQRPSPVEKRPRTGVDKVAALVDLKLLYVGVFLAGAVIVAQFSFWGNYLPLMYPVHLRATGESFAANIGGRMIGTLFAWVTSTLAARGFMPNVAPTDKLAYAAAMIGTFVFALAIVISIWLPEPPGEST